MEDESLINSVKNQKDAIDYFYQNLDVTGLQKIADIFSRCKGKIIFSGMGKSGFIAQKIASTFLSIGKAAIFLSPAEAFHGDLGMVKKEDLFVALSKSGQTKELVRLLPFIKKIGAFTLTFLSDLNGTLKEQSDMYFHLPLLKEICPFNLAPTTSSVLQLLIGDLLAVSLMHKNKFSIEEYAQNHPGGMIGNTTTNFVHEVMLKKEQVPICYKNDRLIDRLCELTEKKCGCLIIVDEKKNLQGIFTDGDLRRAIQQSGSEVLNLPLKELMIRNPKSIFNTARLIDAIQVMESNDSPVMVLPVLGKESEVVGVIRMHDIVQNGLS